MTSREQARALVDDPYRDPWPEPFERDVEVVPADRSRRTAYDGRTALEGVHRGW